ncbi:MAG: hypothetical protein QOC92_2511 [Acidimicrobiaceae bacterium]
MCGGQPLECLRPSRRERESLAPAIVNIGVTAHQLGRDRTIDQLDDGVMLQLEVVRDVTDGRRLIRWVPTHRQQELVLTRRQPLLAGGVLREPEKDTQRVPESSQRPVVTVSEHALENIS